MTKLYDVTLRDGNHALRHQLTTKFVIDYCKKADEAGLYAVEVGHGNGLGASSYLIGKSAESDLNLLEAARNNLKRTKLAVHSIPGIATISKDLIPALDYGVEIFRVATHCTEASVAEKHIEFLAKKDAVVHGVLMMSHMNTINGLISQAELMKKFGASAIVLMDSAGFFIPKEVKIRIEAIKNSVDIEVGFHAHNNQGVSVTNAFEAISAGASIIDGASMGLGAGAGNAQLESIVSNGLRTNLIKSNLKHFLELSRLTELSFPNNLPRITASSIESGMAGVFSGFAPHVKSISEEFGIESTELWFEIGKRKLVAGQESMIREVAQDLMNL
jgi:4-hydroxy 2-oxovalerate aldolase